MKGKRVLLGITGGIAAYKIAFLIRLLRKSEAEVKCIMTPASCDFISPLVVSALSGNPVNIEFWNKQDGTWNSHVDLGLWADVFVIAPLTLNTMSKMVNGNCDNLLLATYFSMKSKTLVAPAMDLDMYAHPATKRNLFQLENDGVLIIPAEHGDLASGLEGEGRMAEPETIFYAIDDFLKGNEPQKNALDGKHILVTAGPTYEAIDPVRFIGNHSSGKMGFSLAKKALDLGAKVTLISGPSNEKISHPNLNQIKVTSAADMLAAVQKAWSTCDVGLFAAAVADYRPKATANHKIKKKDDEMMLELVKNPDILKWAGENKQAHQHLIGFALESEHGERNASEKLHHKNLDMIVLNTLEDSGAGFGVETNKITILDKRNNSKQFELKSKHEVAGDILHYYIEHLS